MITQDVIRFYLLYLEFLEIKKQRLDNIKLIFFDWL